MSLTAVIVLNVILDLAILAAVAYACHLPRRLRPHHEPLLAADTAFAPVAERAETRRAA